MGFEKFFGRMGETFKSFSIGEAKDKKREREPIAPEAIVDWVRGYVQSQQSPKEFLLRLDENRASEYIELMEELINDMELDTDDRREIFRLNQLRGILDRGLEIEICRAKDVPYIRDISRAA